MEVFISSSWRNHNAVRMLTEKLRELGVTVNSWIENAEKQGYSWGENLMPANKFHSQFKFILDSIKSCDTVIYLSPGGMDSCVELGYAFAKNKDIFHLKAKGEDLGLSQVMFTYSYNTVYDLLDAIKSELKKEPIDNLEDPAEKIKNNLGLTDKDLKQVPDDGNTTPEINEELDPEIKKALDDFGKTKLGAWLKNRNQKIYQEIEVFDRFVDISDHRDTQVDYYKIIPISSEENCLMVRAYTKINNFPGDPEEWDLKNTLSQLDKGFLKLEKFPK